MKKTITLHDFREAFRKTRPDSFSYEGLEALFEYLEGLEEDTGEEIEFDVIGLCCDFTEYKSLEEFQDDCGKDEYKTIEEIEAKTVIIPVGKDGFIIQNF